MFENLSVTQLRILKVAILVVIAFIFYLYVITKVRSYNRKTNLPVDKAKSLENTATTMIIILTIFAALNILGKVENIALSTSILGAVVILISQGFFSSFVSGIYLLVSRPFNYGDRIQIGETIGDVISIGLISTKVRTPYNEIITIPNSSFLNMEIKNFDIGGQEVLVELDDIGIGYSSDLKKAKTLVIDVIKEYARENSHLLTEPEPIVSTSRFSDSSINFKIRFYIDDIRVKSATASEVRDRIKEIFDKKGIEIPFPQHVVYMKK